MRYDNDARTVLTLDAGGTNFVFSAVRGNQEVLEPIALPSHADDLDACLKTIVGGFQLTRARLADSPAAVSFAFPGPADYRNGVIGDLGNLPAFRGGVALGPMLEDALGLAAFINNDGDLFALGEAIGGLLPYVNGLLAQRASSRRFRNLVGITLGTGFGGGIAINGELLLGDNSDVAELWRMRSKLDPTCVVEESVSIRAVRRVYAQLAGIPEQASPEPKNIAAIARQTCPGNAQAAREAFRRMGEAAGDALCAACGLIDGLVVVGGGLAGAAPLFFPALVAEMNSSLRAQDGAVISRLSARVFDLESEHDTDQFLGSPATQVTVPGSDRQVAFHAEKRVGIGLSRLGTSRAIAVGAYGYALQRLDEQRAPVD